MGIAAQFGIGIGLNKIAARIMKIEPAPALRGIVERLAEGGEIGIAARQ